MDRLRDKLIAMHYGVLKVGSPTVLSGANLPEVTVCSQRASESSIEVSPTAKDKAED